MNEPTLIILQRERRRRGRPTVDERRSSLSTWIPVSEHDRLIKEANARGMSLSELVRLKITARPKPEFSY